MVMFLPRERHREGVFDPCYSPHMVSHPNNVIKRDWDHAGPQRLQITSITFSHSSTASVMKDRSCKCFIGQLWTNHVSHCVTLGVSDAHAQPLEGWSHTHDQAEGHSCCALQNGPDFRETAIRRLTHTSRLEKVCVCVCHAVVHSDYACGGLSIKQKAPHKYQTEPWVKIHLPHLLRSLQC